MSCNTGYEVQVRIIYNTCIKDKIQIPKKINYNKQPKLVD